MHRFFYLTLSLFASIVSAPAQDSSYLKLAKTIYGDISPKSVVFNSKDLFFAQNMMYKHKITVYNRDYELVATISDKVDLTYCGQEHPPGVFEGSPVEAAFAKSGRYMWVSNYQMYGTGYDKPGSDGCPISDEFDKSYLYRIDTKSFDIDGVVKVGSVPKFLAVTPNNRYVIVSNWCSGSISIVDTYTDEVVKEILLGRFPRGIAVDSKSKTAYVAIMGGTDIAVIDLKSYKVSWIKNVGKKPRHLCISSDDKYLYASINSENKIVKIDLDSKTIVQESRTGTTPRSMVLSEDDKDIFVVNYNSNSISKIDAATMSVRQTIETDRHPIGITYDPKTKDVWVACYSGSIKVFNQIKVEPPVVAEVEEAEEIEEPEGEIFEEEIEEEEVKDNSGRYHIIVGAFGDPNNVKKMLKRCKKAGFSPYIVNPGASVQKVSANNYSSESDARAALSSIRESIEQGAWLMTK